MQSNDVETGYAPNMQMQNPYEGQQPPMPMAPPKRRATVADWSTSKLKRNLRLINLCNGLLLITLGILVFFVGLMSVTFTSITVAAYVVFFGILMTCLECNLTSFSSRFQRNFGFMFSFVGRLIFIIFCGTMALAMNVWLGYIVGVLTFLNGIFNGYVICIHPAFKSGELSAKGDPYGGYTGGEQEMLQYLQSKPDLAQKAGSAAVMFAASNPQAVGSMVGAAAHSNNANAGNAPEANPFQ